MPTTFYTGEERSKRIFAIVGVIAALISLFLRRSLEETSSAETRQDKDAGSIAGLGYTAAGSLIFYTFTTYMQKYLVNTAGMSAKTASFIMTGVPILLALKTVSSLLLVFYCYVTAMMAIAFLFSLRLPKQAAYLHHDH